MVAGFLWCVGTQSSDGRIGFAPSLKVMRRAGTVPYRWVTDARRRGYHVSTFNGPGDFLERMQGLYRADLWEDNPVVVEVSTESRSLAGILQAECRSLAVSLYPCGGFTSISMAHEAATSINDHAGDKDRCIILYAGDYNPAGVLIDKALVREMELHCELDIEFRRIAVNEDQITTYNLPRKPRKVTERRRPDIRTPLKVRRCRLLFFGRWSSMLLSPTCPPGGLLPWRQSKKTNAGACGGSLRSWTGRAWTGCSGRWNRIYRASPIKWCERQGAAANKEKESP